MALGLVKTELCNLGEGEDGMDSSEAVGQRQNAGGAFEWLAL